MYVSPITSSAAAEPLTPADKFERPLLAYINSLLDPPDYGRGPEFARMAWASVLGSLQVTADADMEGGIPVWLANAARRVIRQRTSAAFLADQRFGTVTVQLAPAVSDGGLALIEAPVVQVSASRDTVSSVPLAA